MAYNDQSEYSRAFVASGITNVAQNDILPAGTRARIDGIYVAQRSNVDLLRFDVKSADGSVTYFQIQLSTIAAASKSYYAEAIRFWVNNGLRLDRVGAGTNDHSIIVFYFDD